MSWTPVMRGLLALALVQALLGGVLAISGPDDDGVSAGEQRDTTTTGVPGSPAIPGEQPVAPGGATPPALPGAPPPANTPTAPTIPATGAGRPQLPPAL